MHEQKDDIESNDMAVHAVPQENGTAHQTFSKPHTLAFRTWSRRTKALIALSLVCFFWGTTWIASKEGVRHMPALQLVGLRQTLAGLCFVLYFSLKGTTWPRGREWRVVLMLGFLNFLLSNALSTWGIKYISAGLGAIIGAIVPLWLVLINLVGARMNVPTKVALGLLLGFTGICVIFYEHLHDFLNPEFRLGIFLSLISTWSWACGILYTKKHATGFNPYFSLGLQMLISGPVVTLLVYATGMQIPITSIPWQSWAAIAYLVLFGSVVTFAAFLYALQHLPTEQASIYSYINPIVAVLLGWALFGETLTPFILAGALLTLYGVYLVNRAAVKTGPR